ncbi:MAG: hypothetical protein ACI9XK_003614, partial [Granulosicoccus sp.]
TNTALGAIHAVDSLPRILNNDFPEVLVDTFRSPG